MLIVDFLRPPRARRGPLQGARRSLSELRATQSRPFVEPAVAGCAIIWVMESLTGQMLIAGARITASIFRQAVVLVVEHNEDGAMGFVLNRPSEARVGGIAPALSSLPLSDERLYIGGPVQPEVVAVLAEFDHPDVASRVVFDSLGFMPPEAPAEITTAAKRAKAFAGYAGWGPGQLDQELEDGSWFVESPLVDDVFHGEPQKLWRDALRRKGPEFTLLSTMPFDPSVN